MTRDRGRRWSQEKQVSDIKCRAEGGERIGVKSGFLLGWPDRCASNSPPSFDHKLPEAENCFTFTSCSQACACLIDFR